MIKNKSFKSGSVDNQKIFLFTGKDKLKGRVDIKLDRRRKIDHMGIRVSFLKI